jgi:hypothetical protein
VSEAVYFELGEDITLCNGDITYLQIDYNLPNTFYYWNTGANTPKIRVVAEGEYILTVLTWIADSTVLCRHDDTVRVISTPYPIADFNAYPTEGCTPFIVKMHNETDNDPVKFRTNRLSFFNRWGRKVYDAENYDTFVQNGDITIGKKAFDGKNCPDGTYYYTFYYRGKMKTINVNGSLMILGNVK